MMIVSVMAKPSVSVPVSHPAKTIEFTGNCAVCGGSLTNVFRLVLVLLLWLDFCPRPGFISICEICQVKAGGSCMRLEFHPLSDNYAPYRFPCRHSSECSRKQLLIMHNAVKRGSFEKYWQSC